MPEEEQLLLANLSVFVSGFDLPAAAAVAAGNNGRPDNAASPAVNHDILTKLEALVNKNLVRPLPDAPSPRFDLLFTVRAFAASRLAKQEATAAARQRHAAYFAAQCYASGYDPQANIGALIARMAGERDNLEAAANWLIQQPTLTEEHANQAARLVILIQAIAASFGRLDEGRAWTARILNHRRQLSTEQLINVLVRNAELARLQGDFASALAAYEECLELARQAGDQGKEGLVLAELGTALGMQGDYEQAERILLKSLELESSLFERGMSHNQNATLSNLATVYRFMGRPEKARSLYAEALAFEQGRGDLLSSAGTLTNLGGVALAQQDYPAAKDYYRQTLALAVQTGYQRGLWMAVGGLAAVAAEEGAWTEAAALYGLHAKLSLTLGFSPSPASQTDRERRLANTRQNLSPASFRQAWIRGEQMSVAELL